MFDEPTDEPIERPQDPADRAKERADEFRMHAELSIAYLCDYLMEVPPADLVGPASAPPDQPTEQQLTWFFKLFSLRGAGDRGERMCFFTCLQKSDEDDGGWRKMAEVYGNRTHLGPCRAHNGFEGRERHQATVHLRINRQRALKRTLRHSASHVPNRIVKHCHRRSAERDPERDRFGDLLLRRADLAGGFGVDLNTRLAFAHH